MNRPSLLSSILWVLAPVSRIVNRINWRFGRPFRCSGRHAEQIRDHLQPGTVILTHKKYEFTTWFIPGYWTHSAMVVSPGRIIEATGKGVRLCTVDEFISSVDDFLVLKPRFCCQDTMNKAGIRASALAGLPYSFDFRNSDTMFYCSGLICWAYMQTFPDSYQPHHFPFVLQRYRNGMIIKPTDLYAHPDGWQIISRFGEFNPCRGMSLSNN